MSAEVGDATDIMLSGCLTTVEQECRRSCRNTPTTTRRTGPGRLRTVFTRWLDIGRIRTRLEIELITSLRFRVVAATGLGMDDEAPYEKKVTAPEQ